MGKLWRLWQHRRLMNVLELASHSIYMVGSCLGCKCEVWALHVLETGTLPLDHLSGLLMLLTR